MDLEGFFRILGYQFADPQLLRRALTHRSFGADHNERLEFLGDSVLNCAIALELYRKFPALPEGDLSRLRASLVSEPALVTVARGIGLGGQIALGEGEQKTGGSDRASILADALEAVVGAAFLDGGPETAFGIVRRLFGSALAAADPRTTAKDPKTLLQEYLQGRRIPLPQYAVVGTQGSAHEQVFQVECVIPRLSIRCLGEGTSRRAAEQNAAREAYDMAVRA